MAILAQFLLRLAFGLAVGMAITSPRQVSSGYFRNHLYVTLGLATLAALVLARLGSVGVWLAGAAAVLSFVGAACWLYESRRAGKVMLWLVAATAIAGAIIADARPTSLSLRERAGVRENHENATHPHTARSQSESDLIPRADVWRALGQVTSGLVLGLTFAAMLLGHWYLNAPGMELAPLQRLITATAIAVGCQAIVSGVGLGAEVTHMTSLSLNWLMFIVLRWSFGIFFVLLLLWMARRTLEIPNTQSATGILYVAVIGVFVGELAATLLSAESAFPL